MKSTPKTVLAFACLLLLLSIVPAFAYADDSFIIVSDVDDTVKVTDILHLERALKAALTSKLVFAGMPELYRQLLGPGSSSERLTFLSGAPRSLEMKVDGTLQNARFPPYTLILRKHREIKRMPILEFKLSRLREKYRSPGGKFVLIGDDTEKDPEVYTQFSASPDDRIYIHRITGRALPARCIPFVTAYDIAIEEFLIHRLSEEQAAAVGEDVLTSSDRSLFPSFQKCPASFAPAAGLPASLSTIKSQIERRITKLCASRED